jgi:uncharacterized protein YneR
MPAIPCSQCNAWYDSEHELHDHLRIFHRQFGSEQSSSGPGKAVIYDQEKEIEETE